MRALKPIALLVLLIAGIILVKGYRHHLWLDNFGTVEDKAIYRSGQLQPDQLERVIQRYGIKTVINTRELDAPLDLMLAEYAVCWRDGVELIRLPMPGDGRGVYDQLSFGASVLADTNRQPVLVHCARGTHRTGGIVATYRVFEQGWTPEQALREMKRYRFKPKDHPLVPYLLDFWRDVPAAEAAGL